MTLPSLRAFHDAINFQMLTLAPMDGQDWTKDELRELERLKTACHAVEPWHMEFGKTDAGDPWVIIYDRIHHRAVVHVARIHRRYVAGVPVERRCTWTTTLAAAINLASAEMASVLASRASIAAD